MGTHDSPADYVKHGLPKICLFIIGAAFLFRLATGLLSLDTLADDPDAYAVIARTIASEGIFGLPQKHGAGPTAFRPPLYPWMLSWLVRDGQLIWPAVAVLQALIGAATVMIAFQIGMHIFGTFAAGVCAAALVLIDPILVQQTRLVMTETLATFCVAVGWWAWINRERRPRLSLLAIACTGAAAVLCRPTFIVWSGCVLLLSILGSPRQPRVLMAVVLAVGATVATVAWTIRNVQQMGHPIWATTHGGYTLLLANNDSFYDHIARSPLRIGPLDRQWDADTFLDAYAHRYNADATDPDFWRRDWSAVAVAAGTGGEVADDRYVNSIAKAVIRRRPAMFVWSCVVRMARLWNPLPHNQGWIGAICGVYYAVILAAALAGAVRRRIWRDARWIPAVAIVITLTFVHSVYWSNARMRAPATTVVAVAAAAIFTRTKS